MVISYEYLFCSSGNAVLELYSIVFVLTEFPSTLCYYDLDEEEV